MERRGRRLPPVHPGEILNEDPLKPLGISINGLGSEPPGGSGSRQTGSSATSVRAKPRSVARVHAAAFRPTHGLAGATVRARSGPWGAAA
jgi:hypothetical protein